jgi:hypothetical protein
VRTLTTAFFLLLACFTLAQKAPTAATAGLSANQLKQIRSDKSRSYVVATYIPAGYRLTNFERDLAATGREAAMDHFFSLTYKNSKTGGEFTVQMANGGIGDLMLEAEGRGKLREYPLTGGIAKGESLMFMQGAKPERFGVNWIDRGSKAVFRFVSVHGSGVPLAEARKIANSLTVLR